VALAGGVGGAKLASGLAALLGDRLTVVVNTGDDLERYGLAIWPDHDTVVYNLAGRDDRERGWGLRHETWTVMEALERLGESAWFRLGDRDLATHLLRTERLRSGRRPTEVALEIQAALGVRARVLPMTDEPVRTQVRTDDGWLDFQDYFVRLQQAPDVREIRFRGIGDARATSEVIDAIGEADAIVVCPSNPFVSIGPILAVPGLPAAIDRRRGEAVPVVGVSPIIGGRAVKGPADRMLDSLGHETSALAVARLYADLLDGFVLDRVDAALVPEVEGLGLRAVAVDSLMTDDASRVRLARDVVRLAATMPA
jgi:LPPG:FO 2-phospho-L-lactate transferase